MKTKKTAVKKIAKKIAAEKKTRAPRADAVVQNDVTQPAAGTTCGKIWDACNKSASLKAGFVRADVVAKLTEQGINAATVATQIQRWRVFNGLQGTKSAKAPKAAPKPPAAKGKPPTPPKPPGKKAPKPPTPPVPPTPPAVETTAESWN